MSTATNPGSITAMRRVSAYRTSDDKLYDTRPQAIRHQAELDLTAWLLKRLNDPIPEDARNLAILLIDDARGDGGIIGMLAAGNTPDKKGI